jgi:Rnl2 family RNA ligase
MEFRKFNSLENTYRQNLIEKVLFEGKGKGEWIVSEKIHGANFSFWCDGNEVKVASRTQFVDGTFFNCQSVINKYHDGILKFHRERLEKGDLLVIYGELYGKSVQKEVDYGPKDFRAFDVRLIRQQEEDVA